MGKALLDLIATKSEEYLNEVKSSAKYEEALTEGIEAYERLLMELDEKQRRLLEKYSLTQVEQEGEAADTYFKEGIKFGIRLVIECLTI